MTPIELWRPRADARTTTRLGQFVDFVEGRTGQQFSTYDDLWRWSVGEGLEDLWAAMWDFFEVESTTPYRAVLTDGDRLSRARWFEGAELNYAEHILRNAEGRSDGVAVVGVSQTRERTELTWGELVDQVARARAGLVALGVERGDRVAAYLPNIPETLVAFLATASLGAVWTSCAPEFGVGAVLDRLRQVEPKVLLAVDGYRYGHREVRRHDDVATLRDQLPTVTTVVHVPYLRPATDTDTDADDFTWADLIAHHAPLAFDAVGPAHPLYILYSSGTTGLPKSIVHGHGGILVEHLKVIGLHSDMSADDTFFWFTTTGWMMWNYLVSGLLVGARVVLFDGDPGADGPATLWQLAEDEHISWFGAGATFYSAGRKAGYTPLDHHDLAALRAIGSTGSPLPPEAFGWIYESVAPEALLSPVSGGTDVCSAFVGGSPLTPVWEGEIPCRFLGASVEAYDVDGHSVVGRQGELVITRPMPSMPVGFWGDDDRSRYEAAYFEHYPGVWRHGDWITITDRGSCTISGRSDATLNRGGVRIGTAEIYRVVEAIDGIDDSLVVHLDAPDGDDPGELVLFVVLGAGADLEWCADAVRQALRRELSPRHAPDHVFELRAIPTTLSGKKVEVPAKQILGGADPDHVVSRDSLRDPVALDELVELARSPQWRAGRSPVERPGGTG